MKVWRILVVDDNPDNREILTTVLRHKGFEVVAAMDGETALLLAADCPPDLVLMDISLPRMSGHEAAARLREMPETRTVPILAVSAHAHVDAKSFESGVFDGFLAKPVLPSHVVAEVSRVLRERGSDRAA